MLYSFCSLCGVALPDKHRYALIKDERNLLEEYQSKRFDLCDDCYKDLLARREGVLKNIKDSMPSDGGLTNLESNVIEF